LNELQYPWKNLLVEPFSTAKLCYIKEIGAE